jgi:hypothetical protein
LNISVQVSAAASISIDQAGVNNSTYTTAGWTSGDIASISTATVKNDSGGYTEMWKLSTYAQSNPIGGAVPWTLVESTKPADVTAAPNQYSLFAVFIASNDIAGSCPAAGAADWFGTTTTVNVALAQYGSGAAAAPVYAFNQGLGLGALANQGGTGTTTTDVGSGSAGAKMYPTTLGNGAGQRGLCWKLTMPSSITDTHNQDIQLVVTAQ